MLAFLDGNMDDEIERHLKTCRLCLKELLELNRINSEMAHSDKGLLKEIKAITLQVVKDRIVSFFTNLSRPRVVETGVRKKEKSSRALFQTHYGDFSIKISLQEDETFWITVIGGKKLFDVELLKNEDELPLFSKINAENEVTIKNLRKGNYILKIDGKRINLTLRGPNYEDK
ncbi:MAG: hypothetical protein ACP5QT_03635 [Brevinematia bacterium]